MRVIVPVFMALVLGSVVSAQDAVKTEMTQLDWAQGVAVPECTHEGTANRQRRQPLSWPQQPSFMAAEKSCQTAKVYKIRRERILALKPAGARPFPVRRF
jgi:hypothetical protein